jgi:hypothetical protein
MTNWFFDGEGRTAEIAALLFRLLDSRMVHWKEIAAVSLFQKNQQLFKLLL